jgi:hypothetical protein
MNELKWKRSEEGSTETHCGHYSIEPAYNHSETPQWYTLYHYPEPGHARSRVKIGAMIDTQSECKHCAQNHANRKEV